MLLSLLLCPLLPACLTILLQWHAPRTCTMGAALTGSKSDFQTLIELREVRCTSSQHPLHPVIRQIYAIRVAPSHAASTSHTAISASRAHAEGESFPFAGS